MKKKFSIVILLLLARIIVNAQTLIYSEGFDNGMPPAYKTYDLDDNTPWSGTSAIDPDYKGAGWIAKGGFASSTSYYDTQAYSNDWMITGAIKLPNVVSGNKILLAWQELAEDASFKDGYKVYLNEKDQEVSSFTTLLYDSPFYSTSSIIRYVSIDLTSYAGKTIYLAFQNDTKDKFILDIDNITVVNTPRCALSAKSINNLVYYTENSEISVNGSVLNIGWDTIKSFRFNCQLDNGNVQKADISNLYLNSFGEESYSSSNRMVIPFGRHVLKFWGTGVNGDNTISDTSSLEVYGFRTKDCVPRLSLFEDFGSSTCMPCVAGNKKIKSVLSDLTNKPIVLKYQQNFPGNGDPYNTNETVNRRNYYNITDLPNSVIDGNFMLLNPAIELDAADITNAFQRKGLCAINMKYKIDTVNQSVRIFGTYKPTVDLIEGSRLMIAIRENQTSLNVGGNGETEFDNVVKKFVPDDKGTNIDCVLSKTTQNIDITYTFPGTYRLPINGSSTNRINSSIEHSVEEFNDLSVSVWIENPRDHLVLNADDAEFTTLPNEEFAVESFNISPNPSKAIATVSIKLKESLKGNLSVTDLSGRLLWYSEESFIKGMNKIDLPVINSLAVGLYHVIFRSGSIVAIQELVIQK